MKTLNHAPRAENVKGGPFGVFKHPICCKISKNEGGPFALTKMRFRGIRLAEQIEQNFIASESI